MGVPARPGDIRPESPKKSQRPSPRQEERAVGIYGWSDSTAVFDTPPLIAVMVTATVVVTRVVWTGNVADFDPAWMTTGPLTVALA